MQPHRCEVVAPFLSPGGDMFTLEYIDEGEPPFYNNKFPDADDFPDFKSFQAAVISYMSIYSGKWILPNLASLFFRRPPSSVVQISISDYLSKVDLPQDNLKLVTDMCIRGMELNRETILPAKCMDRFPMKLKQLWNGARAWMAQSIPADPMPEMYHNLDAFQTASENWMNEAAKHGREQLHHPREFAAVIGYLADIRSTPRRVTDVYTKDIVKTNRRRHGFCIREKRSVMERRDWLVDVQLKFRCSTGNETPQIRQTLAALLHDCTPSFKADEVLRDMSMSTIDDKKPIAIIEEMIERGWCRELPEGMGALAGTLLTVNEQHPLPHCDTNMYTKASLVREITKIASSCSFPMHYAFYKVLCKSLEDDVDKVITLFSSEIRLSEMATHILAEFADAVSIQIPQTHVAELEKITGNDEDVTILRHTHKVIFHYQFMTIWLRIFDKNEILRSRVEQYKKKAHEQISLLFKQFSSRMSQMMMHSEVPALIASLFEIMISSGVPEIQRFIYECSNDLFVVLNRIGTDSAKNLNAIIYQIQRNANTSSFIFETFCVFAEHPDIGVFSQPFIVFIKLLLTMNINTERISVQWLSPFFNHVLENHYYSLLLAFTKFLTNADRSEVDNFVLDFLAILHGKIVAGDGVHPDILLAYAVLLETQVSHSFVTKIHNPFIAIFKMMAEKDENLSYAAWNATESFALYHYQSFAKALKKNNEFNQDFALSLKKIPPRSCIVLFSILRMLFKMSMSKRKPGKVKNTKNWKVKLLKRISRVIVNQKLDIVKKTQWALDFLNGSDQQHAQPTVDGLLEFLATHPYGKWFNIPNEQK